MLRKLVRVIYCLRAQRQRKYKLKASDNRVQSFQGMLRSLARVYDVVAAACTQCGRGINSCRVGESILVQGCSKINHEVATHLQKNEKISMAHGVADVR